MENKYYVGIDLGTSSVGWAATDENYNFLRLKGKTAWGARLFDGANTCQKRRERRSKRRRMARRKYRLLLLNQLFAEEMAKVDKTFFLRLANSTYWAEDKAKDDKGNDLGKNIIFKTWKEESEFYNNYKTIWHLRNELVKNNDNAFSDLRLVYLAIHHIIKYRGNFLTEGDNFNEKPTVELIRELNSILSKLDEENSNDFLLDDEESIIEDENNKYISEDKLDKLLEILKSDEYKSKKEKQNDIDKLFVKNRSQLIKKYIDMYKVLVTGGSFKISRIDKELGDLEIDFNNGFDENLDEIKSKLGNAIDLVFNAKKIHDYNSLSKLFGDKNANKNLSQIMVDVYDNHKKDLRNLKKVIRSVDVKLDKKGKESLYYSIFRPIKLTKEDNKRDENNKKTKKSQTPNYASFVQGDDINFKYVTLEKLNDNLKEVLEKNKQYIDDEETYIDLHDKAEKGILLQKPANVSTSLIPHQSHLQELKIILKNASDRYPFIKEIEDKIIKLFMFKVPYYYGPLSTSKSHPYAWVETKEEGTKITPWNMYDVVDEEKTRNKFMKRLINSCSYLDGEPVLPKVSLCYEEYLVLDSLNKMMLNGQFLSPSVKESVLKYILSRSKTTIGNIKTFLKKENELYQNELKDDDISISNIKSDIIFNASSHALLSKYFDLEKDKEMVESLILLATIYAGDSKSLIEAINSNKNYKELTKEQVNAISKLPTNKWGRLSKTFLCGGKDGEMYWVDESIGRCCSILEIMQETNKNLQEVLFDKTYRFQDKINKFNADLRGNKTVKDQIEDIYDEMPSVFVRSVTQTIAVLDDVVRAARCAPNKIYIEVTRADQEKKETKSRYDALKEVIKKELKDEADRRDSLLEKLEYANNSRKLRSINVYLYFLQLGIDFYTGEPIKDLNDVINGIYDKDHIVPQSLRPDDSIDNLVLVNKDYNEKVKRDIYPIVAPIRNEKTLKLWKSYHKRKLISDKKYNSLIRTTELTYEEINDFVNSQINVVNFSNVQLKRILELKYPNTKVCFTKAIYASSLRQKLSIAKMRDLNDSHHAVDAYLNIVGGDILSNLYTDVFYLYDEKKNKKKNVSFDMEKRLHNYIEDNNLKDKIRTNCFRHDALITYKPKFSTSKKAGDLYKETIFEKADKDSVNLIPCHTKGPMKDTKKYGGYSQINQSYILAVEYTSGKKTVKKLLRVPTMYLNLYGNNEEELLKLIVNDEKAKDIKILRKIYINQKIKYNGCYYRIFTKGKKNIYKMAYQNYIDNNIVLYLNKSLKLSDDLIDKTIDSQTFIINNKGEKFIISKEKNKIIFDTIKERMFNKRYDECSYFEKAREMKFEIFNNLSLKEQISTLINMLKLLSCSTESVNINAEFKVEKRLLFVNSPDITKEEIYIVNESPSGLFKGKEELI